ncbi:RNA recognition domain-containing protein [Colletotrichum costaricense]|uniref:RNA recognition domain-containing protein n=1 Tax=Colletotrichum costaricense TaxID=1209916 RepID=A0AAI9YPW3_9PEZI|nr:RNA recognition domain-containing protein [Colletotrichum costaricense]KAK1518839.1 RNA recognition domain-containing protein [Colletotrichum costaricense]
MASMSDLLADPADRAMFMERLEQLGIQHDREQALRVAAMASQNAGQAGDRNGRKSTGKSSSSSEDGETGGGVRLTNEYLAGNPYGLLASLETAESSAQLNTSSLRGSPSRSSKDAAKALRPTSSATAAVGGSRSTIPETTASDVFTETASGSGKDPVVTALSYTLGQSNLQTSEIGGNGMSQRNEYVGGSPSKGISSFVRNVAGTSQFGFPTGSCIFVANLPEYKDDITLEAAVISEFDRFGVVFVKIRRDGSGMPYAFVQFNTKEDAENARIQGRGSLILGRPCRTETVRANRTYIIYRHDRVNMTVEEAQELLTPFGALDRINLLDKEIQEKLGLPVTVRVQFAVHDPSQQVLRAFRMNHTYRVESYDFKKAMQIRARMPHRPPMENNTAERDGRSIFMGDLPLGFTEDKIRNLMDQIGGVVAVHTQQCAYEDGPKQIAFVEFTNVSYARSAIERFNDSLVEDHIIRVQQRMDRRRRYGGFNGGGSNRAFQNNSYHGSVASTPARLSHVQQRLTSLAIEAAPSSEAAQGTLTVMPPSYPLNPRHGLMVGTQSLQAPQNGDCMQQNTQQNTQQSVQQNMQQNMQSIQTQTQMHPQINSNQGMQIQTQQPLNNQIVSQMQMQPGPMQQVQPAIHSPMHMQPMSNQMSTHMNNQIAQQSPMNAQPMGHNMNQQMIQQAPMNAQPMGQQISQPMAQGMPMQQTPVQYPMAPPPVPSQMGTPMHNNNNGMPYYAQGGPVQTPVQQSPVGFWGYGHGTPLWTPFTRDFAPHSSPAHHPQMPFTGLMQSEPVMSDVNQAFVTDGSDRSN